MGQKRTRSGRVISSTTVSPGDGLTAIYQPSISMLTLAVCVFAGKRPDCDHTREIGENISNLLMSGCGTAGRQLCVLLLLPDQSVPNARQPGDGVHMCPPEKAQIQRAQRVFLTS